MIVPSFHRTWSPWLVIGDVIVSDRPWIHELEMLVLSHDWRTEHVIVLTHDRRIRPMSHPYIDQQMQRGRFMLRRDDRIRTTGLNGLQLAAAPARART